MKKIPTLFVRDQRTHKVIDEVTPGCEWVFSGEGVPTRKFDGTCVMIDDDHNIWCRREVKPGKATPDGFIELGFDDVTGKTVGWIPAETSDFWLLICEAGPTDDLEAGTYELIGPKVNGDPEAIGRHILVRHGIVRLKNPTPMTFEKLRESMSEDFTFEGIVWHHLDGRMAKLKAKDFGPVSSYSTNTMQEQP